MSKPLCGFVVAPFPLGGALRAFSRMIPVAVWYGYGAQLVVEPIVNIDDSPGAMSPGDR